MHACMHVHDTYIAQDMDLAKTVPIVLHGDDAECHRRRSFMVVTWGSATIHASPWDSKFVVYVGDNSQCGDEAYAVLDKWTTWSLVELLLGCWLDVDPWGQPMDRPLAATVMYVVVLAGGLHCYI